VYRSCMRWVASLPLLALACSDARNDKAAATGPSTGEGKTLLGIWPEKWSCDEVAPPAELATVLGGEVRRVESLMKAPRGMPDPCSYELTRGPTDDADAAPLVESWSFDLDCRDGYEKTAERIFSDWAQQSADHVAEYQKRVGPGARPPTDDAGVPLRAPQGSHEVALGRRALDAQGQGLIFLDDDAPCYVRVFGQDGARRLALASLVAGHLREANAPMKPHADPVMP
jgi:hypothetical protein